MIARTLTTEEQRTAFEESDLTAGLAAAGGRWWLIYSTEDGLSAVSYPIEDEPAPRDVDGHLGGPTSSFESLPLPIEIVWHDGSDVDADDLDLFEPPEPADLIPVLDQHRFELFGPASGRCICGVVCYGGGGLSGTPGLDAYREHLAAAICEQLTPWTQATSIRKLGATINAVLKARTFSAPIGLAVGGIGLSPHELARGIADELKKAPDAQP